MPPNARQIRCYQHKCDVWRVSRSAPDSQGKCGDDVWTQIGAGISCLYEYTDNLSDIVEEGGRIKRVTVFTDDKIHFVIDADVKDGDIIKNVSMIADMPSPIYGEFHRTLGSGHATPSAGGRRANKVSFLAQTEEHPPTGVV